jgi:hypothetical protein
VVAELIAVTARAGVFVVFLVACVSKVRSRADFAEFRESTSVLVPVVARVPFLPAALVALEALVPFLVSVPGTAAVGLVLAAVLLVAFSAAGVAARLRGDRAICRCFGAAVPFAAAHHVRNGVLAAIAVTGASAAGGPPAELAVTVSAATAGLAMAVLLLALDDLIPLLARTPVEDIR